ncbi:DUF2312 domain-containing protein [bacterium]|nr:DUF2312 domain-containing protein [bacterium]
MAEELVNAADGNEYDADLHIHQASEAEKLNELIERIEEIEQQKSEISATLKEVYDEAKCEGFDVKILKQVVRMRKMEQREIEEEQSVLNLYLQALGMIGGQQPKKG